ncbi:YqzL-like protein [Thermoactinomyces sp. DSM 45891]|nr:YqzL family protein [Thermoactinomyces sp. DSM 45891]SFX66686.1 YqzL-like protein [Thermoactinomyces sp. DSM 45891]
MRNFSWHCFSTTGDIEAYLLYKECEALAGGCDQRLVEDEEEEG